MEFWRVISTDKKWREERLKCARDHNDEFLKILTLNVKDDVEILRFSSLLSATILGVQFLRGNSPTRIRALSNVGFLVCGYWIGTLYDECREEIEVANRLYDSYN